MPVLGNAGSGSADVIVIGGGLVGASIAWGLARQGARTMLLDEGDDALRASRGNFGLVWVQGKGRGCPDYAQWTLLSSELWSEFAGELGSQTGIDIAHERQGGVQINLSEAEAADNERTLAQIRRESGNRPYAYEILDRQQLADLLPGLGPDVVNGSYCPHDGHANPLYLLRALHSGFLSLGGTYHPRHKVIAIGRDGNNNTVTTAAGTYIAPRIVIAAGLATRELARQVGLNAAMKPLHGQIIVTERTFPRIPLPTNIIRQTREGVMMLGYTVDDFGYDTATRLDRSRNVAHVAVRALPYLKDLRVVRSWAALRIMTADGLPIYDLSESHPGVHVATCHSGVTLAAAHALKVAKWVMGGPMPDELQSFSTRRFDVQADH